MDALPFSHVIVVDFEYSARDGNRPEVVCMVAKDLKTGEAWRLFQDELRSMNPPLTLSIRLPLWWPTTLRQR